MTCITVSCLHSVIKFDRVLIEQWLNVNRIVREMREKKTLQGKRRRRSRINFYVLCLLRSFFLGVYMMPAYVCVCVCAWPFWLFSTQRDYWNCGGERQRERDASYVFGICICVLMCRRLWKGALVFNAVCSISSTLRNVCGHWHIHQHLLTQTYTYTNTLAHTHTYNNSAHIQWNREFFGLCRIFHFPHISILFINSPHSSMDSFRMHIRICLC